MPRLFVKRESVYSVSLHSFFSPLTLFLHASTHFSSPLLPLFGSLACCWWGPVIHWAVRGGLAGAAAGLSGQVIKKTTGRGIHRQGWLVSCSRQQSPAASPDPVSPSNLHAHTYTNTYTACTCTRTHIFIHTNAENAIIWSHTKHKCIVSTHTLIHSHLTYPWPKPKDWEKTGSHSEAITLILIYTTQPVASF